MSRTSLCGGPLALAAVIAAWGCAARRGGPPPDETSDESDVKRAVERLFEAYEREDVERFLADVDPEFAGADRTGNAYRFADLPRALRDDFERMERIVFRVQVDPPIVRATEGTAQVDVEWSVRFLSESGRGETLLSNEKSVLNFRKSSQGAWKLVSLAGSPLFGVANRSGETPR